jgi:isocitrate lyase
MGSTPPSTPFPFAFGITPIENEVYGNVSKDLFVTIQNVRGRIPSLKASFLRTMLKESQRDPSKIIATCCSYDGLTLRLCKEAGFPIVFLSGYNVASSQGHPDSGYIAMEDMCHKIQETARQVSIPIFVSQSL